MPATANQTFIATLELSNLLSIEQMQAARKWSHGADSPLTIAKLLARRGWVTRWQAQQLLAGRSKMYLGKYKLLEGLGRGGMGSVFKAEQPALKRVVALKVMSRELIQRPGALARFQREMRAAGALNHPNIVVAHDADSVGDTHFLVMECVNGYNLKEWIEHYGQMPIDWASDVIRQTALGLQHAHEQGMVHRDIKPSNLIIATEESSGLPIVKILDMGLAKFASGGQSSNTNWDGLETVSTAEGSLTMTGQIIGSPNYIAPEQAEDALGADIRSDIYGLGTVFFEMLTGHLPFNGTNILEILRAKLEHEAPRVSDLRPEIPPELDDIVAHMLARIPDDRFQSPIEVADLIEPFADYSPDVDPDSESEAAPEKRRLSDASISIPAVSTIGTTVEAKADDTVNEFIDLLADRAIVQTDEPTIAEKTRQKRDRNKQKDSKAWLFNGMIAGLVLAFITSVIFLWDSNEGKNGKAGKTSRGGQVEPKRENAPPNEHRLVADWVLGNGGQITIQVGGRQRIIKDKDSIPDDDFVIVKLSLEKASGIQIARLGLIKGLISLESVSLSRCDVTDNDLDTLTGLPSLSVLDLSYTSVTGAGLEQLAKITQLTQLNISRTIVSDNGIEMIAELKRLTSLNLEQTDVSDDAVQYLKTLNRLQFLNVRNTMITVKGAKELSAALTDCDVLAQ